MWHTFQILIKVMIFTNIVNLTCLYHGNYLHVFKIPVNVEIMSTTIYIMLTT